MTELTELDVVTKFIHKSIPKGLMDYNSSIANVLAKRLAIVAMKGSKEFRMNRWVKIKLGFLDVTKDSYILSGECLHVSIRKEDAKQLPHGKWLIKHSALVKVHLIEE